ncbi:type IV pilus inner membrane component PilO [Sapientia aquatica]|uniref:Pilus assembly protein PilO n=1 Tax=Sapientia aquatica TaxID=1549640 RepID=A0A4R5W3M1_9BURK|nr:type 4a pilus biogenesis protein PilO [Sapientia aquatica]TDK65929.1 pilus assembly protein PilO [Sapientia aquatica]
MKNMTEISESLSAQFRDLNGIHPGLWPIVPRMLCALGTVIVVVVAGWYFYWSTQFNELEAGQQQEVTLKEDYKNKIQQSINLEGLRKQKLQVEKYVSALEKQLPSKAEMAALLSDITQAGLGRGLSNDLFKPGQAVPKDYYAELPIDVKWTGSYHDIGAFASDIAHLSRIVTLNNLSITVNKDSVLTLDAVAKTFRYLDPEEVATQKKASKGAKK